MTLNQLQLTNKYLIISFRNLINLSFDGEILATEKIKGETKRFEIKILFLLNFSVEKTIFAQKFFFKVIS